MRIIKRPQDERTQHTKYKNAYITESVFNDIKVLIENSNELTVKLNIGNITFLHILQETEFGVMKMTFKI